MPAPPPPPFRSPYTSPYRTKNAPPLRRWWCISACRTSARRCRSVSTSHTTARPRARRTRCAAPARAWAWPAASPAASVRGVGAALTPRVLAGASRAAVSRGGGAPVARGRGARPPPTPRTNWTRRVPHPVLIGHAAPGQGSRHPLAGPGLASPRENPRA